MELSISSGLKEKLQSWPAEQILIWAYQTFGDQVAVTSSFQSQSVPLLHLISRYCPELTVLFIDTGYHFQETLAYRNKLTMLFQLNLRTVRAELTPQEFEFQHGKLYQIDPDECCQRRKVIPLEKALTDYTAWITGIRHDQTNLRQDAEIIEYQGSLVKINPMIDWTHDEIEDYIDKYDLPRHPLETRGYQSIGCYPCTQAVSSPNNYRSGRWLGFNKTECGIHTITFSEASAGMKYS